MLVAGHGSNLADGERGEDRGEEQDRGDPQRLVDADRHRDRAPDDQAERPERQRAEPVVGGSPARATRAARGAAGSTPRSSRRASSPRRPAARRSRRAARARLPRASPAARRTSRTRWWRARSGRRGRTRMPATAPANAPTPIAPRIAPQTAAPPRSASATTGPSELHAPHSTFPIEAESTMLHTHLSERNAPQPSLRSWKNELASRRTCGGRWRPVSRRGADAERRGVDRQRVAGAGGGHQPAREHRPGDLPARDRGGPEPVGLLQAVRADDGGHHADRGGLEEAGRGAGEAGQHGDRPDRRLAGDQQQREDALGREAREVGRDHHGPARQPVRHDAADQQRGHERQRAGREHDADVGCAAAEVDDRERERDVDHPVAEDGHGVRAEQQAEVPLSQDLEAVREARHGRRRLSSRRSTRSNSRTISSPRGSASSSSSTAPRGGPISARRRASSRCSRAPISCSR